jgi:hypothetical protein
VPYPQDLAGKYLDYQVDPGRTMIGGTAMVDGVLPRETTAATVQVYTGQAPGPHGLIPMVAHPPPWTFTFLKYVAGAVTTAPLTGPVLTGPMSGCYLCKYTRRGQQGLAHIGTANAENSTESVAAKTAWKRFVTQPDVNALTGVSSVTGGNASDYFAVSELEAAKIGGKLGKLPQVVGYFDGGSAYAMLLAPLASHQNSLGRPMLKVAAIKAMTLQPWSTIAAMRTWR